MPSFKCISLQLYCLLPASLNDLVTPGKNGCTIVTSKRFHFMLCRGHKFVISVAKGYLPFNVNSNRFCRRIIARMLWLAALGRFWGNTFANTRKPTVPVLFLLARAGGSFKSNYIYMQTNWGFEQLLAFARTRRIGLSHSEKITVHISFKEASLTYPLILGFDKINLITLTMCENVCWKALQFWHVILDAQLMALKQDLYLSEYFVLSRKKGFDLAIFFSKSVTVRTVLYTCGKVKTNGKWKLFKSITLRLCVKLLTCGVVLSSIVCPDSQNASYNTYIIRTESNPNHLFRCGLRTAVPSGERRRRIILQSWDKTKATRLSQASMASLMRTTPYDMRPVNLPRFTQTTAATTGRKPATLWWDTTRFLKEETRWVTTRLPNCHRLVLSRHQSLLHSVRSRLRSRRKARRM